MPDYEISLTSTRSRVAGSPHPKTTVKSVTLENYQRNLAIPAGLTELMRWAAEEHMANPESEPVPVAAIQYWEDARQSGNIPLMEIQTKLQEWGITFALREIKDEEPPPVHDMTPRARNGKAVVAPRPAQRMNLRELLSEQLAMLQERQKQLTGDRRLIDEEMTANRRDIQEIVQFLTLSAPSAPNGRKRKVKVEVHATPD